MSRQFNLRLNPDLAAWLRAQGPPQEAIHALAVRASKGTLNARVPDPGPGSERVSVRILSSWLRPLRALTGSRDALAGLRKLIAAGAGQRALPPRSSAPRVIDVPVSRAIVSRPRPLVPARPLASGRPAFLGYRDARTPEECQRLDAFLVRQMGAQGIAPRGTMTLAAYQGNGSALESASAGLSGLLEGYSVVALGVAALGIWLLPKIFAALAPAKAAGAVSAAAKGAAWVPKAISGLGGLVW